MTVLLNNLSARPPAMSDLDAVSELLAACDIAEGGIQDCTREELDASWQRPGFDLKTDAWVIVTKRGQVVGYAGVWHRAYLQICTYIRVHPAYRSRGIGTLLLRLVEHRARNFASKASSEMRVVMSATVSSANEAARQLLEREGYSLARYFWRVVIDMNESLSELYRRGKLEFDLVIDPQTMPGVTRIVERTGMYAARQYSQYEKELRPGCDPCEDEEPDIRSALV